MDRTYWSEIEADYEVQGTPSLVLSTVKTGDERTRMKWWLHQDQATRIAFIRNLGFTNSCHLIPVVEEDMYSMSIRKSPAFVAMGIRSPTISLSTNQDPRGSGSSPFDDGRWFIKESFVDVQLLVEKAYWLPSLYANRMSFLP
jgi:hypothetical protein